MNIFKSIPRKSIATAILVNCCLMHSLQADSSQYEGNMFEGTNLNHHWATFYKPPYIYKDNEIISVKATTSREALLSMVPKELSINEDNQIIFFVGTFRVAAYPFSYKEAGIVIPVTYKKGTDEEKKGSFVPILYLDNISSIIGGRETYGYNKHYADIELVEKESSVRGIVNQNGKTLIDISVSTDQPKVTDSLKLDSGGHFVIKRIPAAVYDGSLEIHQLNYVEVSDYVVEDYIPGAGGLTLGGPEWEQLNKIPINNILEAYYSTTSSTLGAGTTLHDYLNNN
ncbi:MAG: acetoacetate decarboxylase family protein [Gammaproteobacteria bacterium]